MGTSIVWRVELKIIAYTAFLGKEAYTKKLLVVQSFCEETPSLA